MPEASEVSWVRRRAPELTLIAIAAVVFLGRLGAMDLWGKREQRATAEALDTVDHDNWLVAYIQCRPRLEKPPLPRWTIAGLMNVTGIRDEWIVRLPSALTAAMMVGLVYGLGRRIGGRTVGLASGLALCSTLFFVVESRQAGNDGPLAFFTTLALYAAFRRLHGGPVDEPCGLPGDRLGSRYWALLAWVAMGAGFLSKGPVAMILPALAMGPYLMLARRFRAGALALFNAAGVLAFLALTVTWPVLVLLSDPKAAEIWMLEMGQKAGTAGITHHKQRYFLLEWPWLTAPWTLLATWGAVLPFLGRGRSERPLIWFPWSWAVGNFAMFCLWSVAKPNYYVPCEPGVALLVGLAWARLSRLARESVGGDAARARLLLRLNWGALLLVAAGAPIAAPILARANAPELSGVILPWTLASSAAIALGVALSVRSWRRGRDSAAMAALVAGLAFGMTITYAKLAPKLNPSRSHRRLAARLDRVLPPEVTTVMFYRELDEGLWYYLKGRTLVPVPESAPKYSRAADLLESAKNRTLIFREADRIARERKLFVDWLKRDVHESPYVLIRSKVYDWFNPGLDEWAKPVFRERNLDRSNELVLLRIRDRAVAQAPATPRR